jgi:PHD/YefM family antitoxin component YafN of YafNO toxin-antitoxin module
MLATEHTQSLTDFRLNAAETLERLNQTGEAEIITVNGEACAVLLSPAAYSELAREAQLSRDVAVIRRSMQQFESGDSKEVNEFFAEMRTKSLAMKATAGNGGNP